MENKAKALIDHLLRVSQFVISYQSPILCVCSTLDLANDVVSLAEEGEPFVQDNLVLVLEVIPFWNAVLWLEGGFGERTRRVLAGEDWFLSVEIPHATPRGLFTHLCIDQ